MRKVFKWIGIILGSLIGLVFVLAVMMIVASTLRTNKIYEVQPDTVSIPTDADSIGRGGYLYASSCSGCHGDNLSGKVILDDPAIGYVPASNLTSGIGGIGGQYNDIDFVRAIRHGVSAEGKPLMIMPSKAYWHYSDEDLGAIIAYLNTVLPLDNNLGEKNLKPVGRIMLTLGAFGEIFAAEVLDHNAVRPSSPQRTVTAGYGDYLVKTGDCSNCHGPSLTGAQSPEPGSPFSSNLTPEGELGNWSASQFIETMRTGVTPDGRTLDASYMPWKEYARKTDDDLTAIFLYLQSLPAQETNSQ